MGWEGRLDLGRVVDYLMKKLEEFGVSHIFMVTGRGALFLTDTVAARKNMKAVCMHNEQSAAIIDRNLLFEVEFMRENWFFTTRFETLYSPKLSCQGNFFVPEGFLGASCIVRLTIRCNPHAFAVFCFTACVSLPEFPPCHAIVSNSP